MVLETNQTLFPVQTQTAAGLPGPVGHTILDAFWRLQSFWKWDKWMHINLEDQTSDTTQYQDTFLKNVENEFYAKHQPMSISIPEQVAGNIIFPSLKASGFGQSSYDPYDSSSDDQEYITPKSMVEMTPRGSDHPAHLLTASRLYFNSQPEAPKNWGQVNPYLDDYHSNCMEISNAFCIPDVTNWWQQQEQTHLKYTDLSNVACHIFSMVPQGVGVEAGLSLGPDVIGSRQSTTTGYTHWRKVVVRQCVRANHRKLAGDYPGSDTTDTDFDLELKKDVEAMKLHRMANVHDFLEMCQGSQNLLATQTESRTQNEQMTAVG